VLAPAFQELRSAVAGTRDTSEIGEKRGSSGNGERSSGGNGERSSGSRKK